MIFPSMAEAADKITAATSNGVVLDLTTAMIMVGGFAAMSLILEIAKKYLSRVDKNLDARVMTEDRHNACKSETITSMNEFKKEVRSELGQIKGILLVLATKGEISVEQIQKLVARVQAEE
jgi:hypothetical protein